VEWLEKIEKQSGVSGLARREFLTVMGASMALAATACARRPVTKIIPYVTKPEDVTPGVANHYASTYSDGPTPYGILVKVREGRPVKIEGNEQHPVNQGKLCVRGQASLLSLYDPERLKAPTKRESGATAKAGDPISWTDADAAIVAKLKAAASSGARVRMLSGVVKGDAQARLIREFLAAFKGAELVQWEPLAGADVAQGQEASYGTAVLPAYRFDKAEFVLSLGADFLSTWLSPVEHAGQWAKTRKLENGRKELSKLYVFESMMTSTGASSDERYPIRPGDELKVALAVAHELIVARKLTSYAGDSAVTGALSAWKPELVAAEIGLDGGAEVLKRVATHLWNARGKSLVVSGGIAAQTADAGALQVVTNLLNSALQNEGVTVDGTARATASTASFEAVQKLIAEMKSGQVDVLLVHGSNARYWLPNAVSGFDDAVSKVPFVVAIADREDETARLADFVLPEHHYLENW
jgi:anaerobic selenocysteine-containing dehydrogenase